MPDPWVGPAARDFAAAQQEPDTRLFVLRLCVSGMTPRSQAAIINVTRLCAQHLADRHSLEIIDIYQQPELARQYQIVATPTLIKEAPLPEGRILGSLSDMADTLKRLGVRTAA